jgi:hypothetical protein
MSSKDPLSLVKSLFTKLESECKTESTKQKLRHINQACATTHKNGGSVAIASIVSMLNSSGIKLSSRTIYNKKDGPYRKLLDGWINVSSTTDVSGKLKGKINLDSPVQLIEDKELLKIDDHVLRYKISLMSGQIKGLQNQLSTIRAVRDLPLLNAGDALPLLAEHDIADDLGLSTYDIDVLKDFVKESKSKSIGFDEDDTLIATKPIARHDFLSQQGLKEIIDKIIKLYTLPEN